MLLNRATDLGSDPVDRLQTGAQSDGAGSRSAAVIPAAANSLQLKQEGAEPPNASSLKNHMQTLNTG